MNWGEKKLYIEEFFLIIIQIDRLDVLVVTDRYIK